MTGFERLHPAIQHHIVNSLGWKKLRNLQEQAIGPVLDGEQSILLAPTAGGKTEAAVFPILSRMLAEDWAGLSVLYVCPIKALLNNLEPRLRGYAELLGRRVSLWHGDIAQPARKRILSDPPDLLLTTPESIEVMLTSTLTDHRLIFKDLQCVVVDEMHAFAGDDRGWHLLSLLERLAHLTGRDLQRLGLSATVGNAEELLAWLSGSSSRQRRVVAPEANAIGKIATTVDVRIDYVGSLENAARVISRLHSGEKRLVFCDSRSRVESLAANLREAGVNTFVSHSSLSLDERRLAEDAFAEGRDAVIVATSTLELGIDVGDLDRVIQIDAPTTVASFLQRLGRTGRRPGTERNCLFLATNEQAFLKAAGLLELFAEGYVEPVNPPAYPYHVLAQQIMALILQEKGIGRHTWREWLGGMPAFKAMAESDVESIVEHMIATEILFEDSGILSFGQKGERSFGYRHFMDLMTVFTSDPLFIVRHGRTDLGTLHPLSFHVRGEDKPIVLLAGRSWVITHVNWKERVAYVQPSEGIGRSQWLGSSQPLSSRLCRAIRKVLSTGEVSVPLTARGKNMLEEIIETMPWVEDSGSAVVRTKDGKLRWWTFAGLAANSEIAAAIGEHHNSGSRPQNFYISLQQRASSDAVRQCVKSMRAEEFAVEDDTPDEVLDGLKFSACLPKYLALRTARERMSDPAAIKACLEEPIRSVDVA